MAKTNKKKARIAEPVGQPRGEAPPARDGGANCAVNNPLGRQSAAPQVTQGKGGGQGLRNWILAGVVILVVGSVVAFLMNKDRLSPQLRAVRTNTVASDMKAANSHPPAQAVASSVGRTNLLSTNVPPATNAVAQTNALPAIEINKALMVTVELEFGSKIPTIAEALRQVERRHLPDDGQGRTFSILDAYGEPTPQGKLHMSMHVSMEKPGIGRLIDRRTGEVLWESRIILGTNASVFTGKNLSIYMDNGKGGSVTIDGSQNPATILEAGVKEAGVPVSLFWPEGSEREFTFLYSACGCPVKAMVKRVGDKTIRTKETPVLFPDDPSVMVVINRLMGW